MIGDRVNDLLGYFYLRLSVCSTLELATNFTKCYSARRFNVLIDSCVKARVGAINKENIRGGAFSRQCENFAKVRWQLCSTYYLYQDTISGRYNPFPSYPRYIQRVKIKELKDHNNEMWNYESIFSRVNDNRAINCIWRLFKERIKTMTRWMKLLLYVCNTQVQILPWTLFLI